MSFVSYAQNFEDVMLWRALRHVENGTYVDVGAQDPVVDSVSRAFYEHGWRGVHIEPVPFYAERLRQDRPGEIVLQAALGETSGTLTLTVIPGTGLSTAVNEHSQRHHEAGFETETAHVPMLTLNAVLGVLAGRDVHWLKIDVEGFEEAVLKGWDSTVLRPWILVIEATIPGSSETDYDHWDPLVIAAGYRFVYFDGLNRFYVANEHPELFAAFAAPPNVFDGVELSGLSSWGLYRRVEAQQQALLAQSQAEAGALGQELAEQRTALADSQALLAEREVLLIEREAALADQAETLAGQARTLAGQAAVLAMHVAAAAEQDVMLAECKETLAGYEATLADRAAMDATVSAAVHDWWSVADRLNHEVQALRASTSWRVTAPLRALSRLAAGVPQLAPRTARWIGRRVRIAGRPLLLWSVRNVLARPGLRARLLRILANQPRLKQYLRRFASRAGLVAFPVSTGMQADATVVPASGSAAADIIPPAHLGTRASRIYGQLKRQSS